MAGRGGGGVLFSKWAIFQGGCWPGAIGQGLLAGGGGGVGGYSPGGLLSRGGGIDRSGYIPSGDCPGGGWGGGGGGGGGDNRIPGKTHTTEIMFN